MLKTILAICVSAALVMSIGCSKVEDAAKETRKKGNEAFDKIVVDPQKKAEKAKDDMNRALEKMQKDINRATEDAK